jgi:predicted RND superfamily exporter protein
MQKVRLSFRVKDIGTKRMEAKEDTIYKQIEQIFPADKHKAVITGSSIISFKGNKYLISNLFTSLALTIVLIASFMAWMFRSKRMVLIALVPNVIPQIITAAIMGYFGIPIKASTILVFSVAFGISVDNTIHYLAKYRQDLQATNWDMRSSVVLALKETGQSMIYTSIILFFGFGIFCLSSFGGTFALEALTAITLFAAMLANLILLPSLLLTMEHSITKKTFRAEPLLQIYDEEEDIDENKLEIEYK